MRKIYCVGGASIDKKLKILHDLTIATSNPVTSMTTHGGVARNIAENLAQWTNEVYFQSVIGRDAEGHALLQHLKQLNVNTEHCLSLEKRRTAHYYAILHPSGEMHNAFADMEIFNHIPVSDFISNWSQWEEGNILFLDTNLPEDILHHALHSYASTMLICIDPVSIAKSKKLPPDLSGIYLLKPNQQEAEILSGISIHTAADSIKAGLMLIEKGLQNCVISLGKNGYSIINSSLQKHVSAENISSLHDENGAGDAFMAGILFGIQQNKDLLQACEFGAKAAASALQSQHSVTSLKLGVTHASIF